MATLFQDDRPIGEVAHVRISSQKDKTTFTMDVSEAVAAALDTERPCVLEDDEGHRFQLSVFKTWYSWGAFRAHGQVLEDGPRMTSTD